MTRKEALQALMEKVMAFKPDNPQAFQHLPDSDYKDAFGIHWEHAARANRRDMNAARSLHEAVLPGWLWGRQYSGQMWIEQNTMAGYGDRFYGEHPDPAVAWLIAIITGEIARCE